MNQYEKSQTVRAGGGSQKIGGEQEQHSFEEVEGKQFEAQDMGVVVHGESLCELSCRDLFIFAEAVGIHFTGSVHGIGIQAGGSTPEGG